MALKFLNKKGWHTGSLRNIENVWKAEQKRDAEQKKLEELRVQIQQERERSEFRALQEQAGLVPAQERLDFLYDSGLSVGKGGGSSSGTGVAFQSLDQPAKADTISDNNNDNKQQSSAPGALFEEKPQSANDTWRKLHSDPLLLIRQREQEALARVKNNPVQMALIRQSVQEKKPKEKARDKKDRKKKHRHSSSKHHKHSSSKHHSDSEEGTDEETYERKSNEHKASRGYEKQSHKTRSDSEDELIKRENGRETRHKESYRENSSTRLSEREKAKHYGQDNRRRDNEEYEREKAKNYSQDNRRRDDEESGREKAKNYGQDNRRRDTEEYEREKAKNYGQDNRRRDIEESEREKAKNNGQDNRRRDTKEYEREQSKNYGQDNRRRNIEDSDRERHSSRNQITSDREIKERDRGGSGVSRAAHENESQQRKRRGAAPKLSEEERAARLREMQMDAELHEEQRWKRLKKAEEDDAEEAKRNSASSRGKNFLDDANKRVYGTEKGGSSTIEESVRRRTHYSQRGFEAEGNAFRR